jgi:hypothetical protein
LRSSLQKTIDFVLSENMAGPTPLWRVAEDIDRRHLMSLVFRIE